MHYFQPTILPRLQRISPLLCSSFHRGFILVLFCFFWQHSSTLIHPTAFIFFFLFSLFSSRINVDIEVLFVDNRLVLGSTVSLNGISWANSATVRYGWLQQRRKMSPPQARPLACYHVPHFLLCFFFKYFALPACDSTPNCAKPFLFLCSCVKLANFYFLLLAVPQSLVFSCCAFRCFVNFSITFLCNFFLLLRVAKLSCGMKLSLA